MIAQAFIVLLAGFVQSVTGFGFALVATPLLLWVLDPKSAVVTSVILYVVLCGMILYNSRHHIDKRRVMLISAGSVFGIPLGAIFLSTVNPNIIKLIIALLVIPFSVLLLRSHTHHFKNDKLGCGVAGFFSGVLSSSTGLAGPPVVLFLLNQNLVKERFVGTLVAYFLFSGLFSIAMFAFMGIISSSILNNIFILLPILLVGFFIGIKVRSKINESVFKKITILLMFATSLSLIATFILDSH